MIESDIKNGISLLCDTSLKVESYFENDQKLVNALNNVPFGLVW